MAGRGLRQSLNHITAYLLLVITIATVGSLQYGYHLVRVAPPSVPDLVTLTILPLGRTQRAPRCHHMPQTFDIRKARVLLETMAVHPVHRQG